MLRARADLRNVEPVGGPGPKLLALVALLGSILEPIPGRAETQTSSTAEASRTFTNLDVDPHRLHWDPNWRSFDTKEYAVLGGLLAGLTAWFTLAPARAPGWRQPLLFDDAIRSSVVSESDAERNLASDVSQGIQLGVIAYPLVDAALVAAVADDNPDLAWRLTLINAEAYAVSSALILATKHNVGRIRPNTEPCEGTSDDFSCRNDTSHASLLSGHSTAAFTAAGLVCAHHENLPMYGDPILDAMACASALTLAGTTAVLRVTSNRHWATDAVMSAGVGLLSGYGLPTLLHYRSSHTARSTDADEGSLVVLALSGPFDDSEHVQLTLGGSVDVHHTLRFGRPLGGDLSLALELGADGRLLTTDGLWLKQLLPGARLWLNDLALGAFVDYRHVSRLSAPSDNAWALGPSVAFALFRSEDLELELSGRWAPLLQGSSNLLAARIDVALLEWLAVGAELQTIASDEAEGEAHAMGLFGVGGRVPW